MNRSESPAGSSEIPLAPTQLLASADTVMVNLDWADNTDADLASYSVYRSTTQGGSHALLASGLTTSSYQDTAVTSGTTYFYVVTAVDTSANESDPSNEASAGPDAPLGDPKVPVDDPSPPVDEAPTAPVGLMASGDVNAVNLTWNANPEGDLAGYFVYRSTTSGSGYLLLATGIAASNYRDTAVASGTTYFYVATAVDAAGNESGLSNEASAAPTVPVDNPPAEPTGLAAAGDVSVVHLTWADNTESDLASYSVYRSTTPGSGYALLASGLTLSAYSDSTVTEGTTYFYVVTAWDQAGNESAASNEASASPLVSLSSVTLFWDAPTTNADGTPLIDLAGYRLYQGTSPGQYTTPTETGNVTQFTVNGLASGTYFFTVTAYDLVGNESTFSNELSVTVP